jgi:flagellar basal-body rod protein FlgB
MLARIFQHTTVPVLEEVVHFTEARHEVLAGNIANIDTPGYRTADLSPEVFQTRLREALEERDSQGPTPSASLDEPGPGDPIRQVRDSMKTIVRHDQADVGMEQQVLAMSKNQFSHNMAIALMSSQFRLLETAVSERI